MSRYDTNVIIIIMYLDKNQSICILKNVPNNILLLKMKYSVLWTLRKDTIKIPKTSPGGQRKVQKKKEGNTFNVLLIHIKCSKKTYANNS